MSEMEAYSTARKRFADADEKISHLADKLLLTGLSLVLALGLRSRRQLSNVGVEEAYRLALSTTGRGALSVDYGSEELGVGDDEALSACDLNSTIGEWISARAELDRAWSALPAHIQEDISRPQKLFERLPSDVSVRRLRALGWRNIKSS